MFLSFATVKEIELERSGFWLEAEITVPENVFAAELVLEKFNSDAQSEPLSNLFAGTHNLTVRGSGVPPVAVGDTIPAKCFAADEIEKL